MQTELTLRLIKDGKIVGYERKYYSQRFHQFFISTTENIDDEHGVLGDISHDSFELGIKVGDIQWFEGDIFSSKSGNLILVYKEEWSCWGFRNEWGGFFYGGDLKKTPFKKIGTIHD